MIENFDLIIKQLKEIAPIINEFKSEAVQLRVVELVFKNNIVEKNIEDNEALEKLHLKDLKHGSTKKKSIKTKNGSKVKTSKKTTSNRATPTNLLDQLINEGYFKSKRKIGEIIDHLSEKKAHKYKTTDLSTPLTRFVRNGKLERTQGENNSYEYFNK